MTALIETQLIQLAYFAAQINTQVCTKGVEGGWEAMLALSCCHHGHSSKYTEGVAHIQMMQLWCNHFRQCELMWVEQAQ